MALALRERRRIETILLIRKAALRLAGRHGYDSVTVEAICAEAGISVRTFFNYFPVREAAFVVGPPPFPPEAVRKFLSGTGPFLDELIALLQTRLRLSGDERRELCQAMDMATREPRMAAMQISAMHAHEVELATLIGGRLKAAPADTTPKLMAAAILAVTRAVISRWAADEASEDVCGLLDQGLRAVLALMASQPKRTRAASRRKATP